MGITPHGKKGNGWKQSFFIDFGKVVIWRMGPGTTWVGPAPRCGHPAGRVSPPASTGRRSGRPNVFVGLLNCIFEVAALLKKHSGRSSWRGNELPGTASALGAPSETWQGIYLHPGGVESTFGWHQVLTRTQNWSVKIPRVRSCGARGVGAGSLRAVGVPAGAPAGWPIRILRDSLRSKKAGTRLAQFIFILVSSKILFLKRP